MSSPVSNPLAAEDMGSEGLYWREGREIKKLAQVQDELLRATFEAPKLLLVPLLFVPLFLALSGLQRG